VPKAGESSVLPATEDQVPQAIKQWWIGLTLLSRIIDAVQISEYSFSEARFRLPQDFAMADLVVLEFSAPNAVNIYRSVNKLLGWDGVPAPEDLPTGMISHVAGESGDKLVVVEVWESQAAQGEFMNSQLGPAFAEANVPQPSRVEWFTNIS
jgi:hypothetical protein